MSEILLAIVILVSAYLYYAWIMKPKRVMAEYAKLFRSHGYRVAQLPYKPFGSTFYDQLTQDESNKDDAFYSHKHIYPEVDVLICNMLNKPDICLMNVNLVKDVMSADKLTILHKEKKLSEVFWYIFRTGIFRTQGNQWKKRRKIISKVFTHQFIRSLFPMMNKFIDEIFEKYEEDGRLENSKEKAFKVDMFSLLTKFTSSVIISGFMGMEALKHKHQDLPLPDSLLKLIGMCTDTIQDPLLLIFGQKLLKKRWRKCDRELLDLWGDLNNIIQSILDDFEKKRKETKGEEKKGVKSLVELLMDERDRGDSESNITNTQLIDEIKTFVIAATDTTSNFLTALLFYMFQKPEIVRKIKAEIKEVIKTDEDINYESFKKMPYLECLISEGSRMFNSAPTFFQRQLTQDTTIGGVPIKKNLLLDVILINQSYNKQVIENPFEFIPERWEKEEYKEHQHLASMIFSGGPRNCIGKSLALANSKVFLIKFLQRYSNLIEEGIQDGKKRAYDYKLLYHVRNTSATLIRED